MFDWLSKIKNHLHPGSESGHDASENRLQLAVAILLVEIMHADHELESEEQRVVTQSLKSLFNIDHDAASKLHMLAEEHMNDAVSLHEYTSLINDSFSYADKLGLINSLWRVAYADNQLDRYEEHLIRRLADLLYVSHSDYIKEKHNANKQN